MLSSQTPEQAAAAALEATTENNTQLAAAYFAVAILGLIIIITILQCIEAILVHCVSKNDGPILQMISNFARTTKSILIRKIPGFASVGHALLFVVYLAINIALCFENVNWNPTKNFSKRVGWITAANLCLVTLLGLKNTPLAILTRTSYEKLNTLHQSAGYTTIVLTVIHAVIDVDFFAISHKLDQLSTIPNIMGCVAGVALLVILFTAIVLRKRQYELFYILHILLFFLILIAIGMHCPTISSHVYIIPVVCAAIWALDRLIRIAGLTFHLFIRPTTATLTPLPNGAVSVVLSRPCPRAEPGSHVFLYLPALGLFQTHPFTISSSSPVSFLITPQKGFTSRLSAYAVANPGVALRAALDGPYGAIPNFASFDRVLLMAAGAGASFTVGVAVALVRKLDQQGWDGKTIDFLWVVRNTESLHWFSNEIAELRASKYVRLCIHVTQSTGVAPSEAGNVDDAASSIAPSIDDVEKGLGLDFAKSASIATRPGRPDLQNWTAEAMQGTERGQRVIIAGCGPKKFMRDARKTAAETMKGSEATVSFFAEEFDW